MEKIKINGKAKYIPSISELTFRQFNDIIVKGNALELKEYLSLFLDLPVEQIMKSTIICASIPALHQKIYNLNIEEVLKDTKSTIEYNGEIYTMSELEIDTFGKAYMFELMRLKQEEGKINQYELCLYAMALSLSKHPKYDDVDEIFKSLYDHKWTSVISQSFFLAKRINKKRIQRLLLSTTCIWELRAIRLKMAYYQKKLKKLERK